MKEFPLGGYYGKIFVASKYSYTLTKAHWNGGIILPSNILVFLASQIHHATINRRVLISSVLPSATIEKNMLL
jgi:hypothetical protein